MKKRACSKFLKDKDNLEKWVNAKTIDTEGLSSVVNKVNNLFV